MKCGRFPVWLLIFPLLFFGCSNQPAGVTVPSSPDNWTPAPSPSPVIVLNPDGDTVLTRFNPPTGYRRVRAEEGSFGDYLQHLSLKPHGTPVTLHDGSEAADVPAAAVLNLTAGKKIQRPVHAMIRLRAEHLYSQGAYDRINYHFLSGFLFPFAQYAEGYRVSVDGQSVQFSQTASPASDYETFTKYLECLFTYTNAASLSNETVPVASIQLGDMYLNQEHGGVMVVDAAFDPETGQAVFMLAQGLSDSGELIILENKSTPALSPWIPADFDGAFETAGGGRFAETDLRRFEEPAEEG